jgi:dimethylhistidine N-methyltransferase
MSTLHSAAFARDVREGLTPSGQKRLPPVYFYDAIGSVLFEAITLLPEYGLTRADTRVIETCAPELPALLPGVCSVAELGSGSGKKTAAILEVLGSPAYFPIDVSATALEACANAYTNAQPIRGDYLDGLAILAAERPSTGSMLLLFLGSTIGNFAHEDAAEFLRKVRATLRPGDALMIGADIMSDIDRLLLAYDDPLGVTAAFNLNVLGRMNRELSANFDIRRFRHQVRWSGHERAVEMHLMSLGSQTVQIPAAKCTVTFEDGETIWTESSHKYTVSMLDGVAAETGFTPVRTWTDDEWPFAECLWTT